VVIDLRKIFSFYGNFLLKWRTKHSSPLDGDGSSSAMTSLLFTRANLKLSKPPQPESQMITVKSVFFNQTLC
jgi:hypothetical protein